MSEVDVITFGKRLREVREQCGISLRELAKAAKISAPFLSDVELGRRFPKDETLMLIAKRLRVSVESLKQHDHRIAIADLKRMTDSAPGLGAALRGLIDQVNSGALTTAELTAKLRELVQSYKK